MPSRRTRVLAVTANCVLAVTHLRAQQPTGVVVTSGATEIHVGGRVQTQFSTSTVDTVPATGLELRRLRLELLVKFNDVVSGKIQPDFAPGDRVAMKDAWMKIALDPAFTLLAGQAHRPFSPIAITSSTRILPIERGLRMRGLSGAVDEYNIVSELGYSERDVGLQVLGAPKGAPLGLTYQAGFFNGPARSKARDRNTYQLAARATISPASRLRIGASWSSLDFVRTSTTPGATVDVRRGNAWEADVEYGAYDRPGLHLLAETAYGDFQPFTGARFFGVQTWLAYRSQRLGGKIQNVEPLLRASYADANVNDRGPSNPGGLLLTPGVNLYLGSLNRVQFNWDFWNPLEGESHNSFKTQFQVAF
ncbi:MAG TPA: porin [Longimicrobium sp.]|nr:porin [Longimicrobium sp.]